MTLYVMIFIWIVMGVIIAALAENIFTGERPYGTANDYVISIVATVLTGFADWYIVPIFFSGQIILFIAAVLEPPLVALFCLWLARKIKSR